MNTQRPVCKDRSQGFTLLEVLVAMSILFMAVGTAMVAFQTNQQASARATQLTHLVTHIDAIVMNIQPQLNTTTSGEGEWLGIYYRWQASLIETRPARTVSATAGSGDTANREFSLYWITVEADYRGMQREFNVEEVMWNDLN